MLALINPTRLDYELAHENIPILAAFLRKDHGFGDQINILEQLSESLGDYVQIYLGDEYFLDTFFQRFGFHGTPCYLLLSQGREQGRFLGQAHKEDLERMLQAYHTNNMEPDQSKKHRHQ
jgi:hypothetical protein